jgi:hypothetical protein
MANPNLANVTSILGNTDVLSVTTTATAITTNSAASGLIYKVNSLTVANIDGTNPADITAYLVRSATNYAITSTITVPADATLVVISKDSAVYLEEGDSITLTASANGDLQAICSYEILSS